jgi:hypothetical protein
VTPRSAAPPAGCASHGSAPSRAIPTDL